VWYTFVRKNVRNTNVLIKRYEKKIKSKCVLIPVPTSAHRGSPTPACLFWLAPEALLYE
jgi:hypothetical protein